MIPEMMTNLFLEKLDEQGFNLASIIPYLKLTWYEYNPEEGEISARFEVEYPGLRPICQYVRFDELTCTTRDEWFLPGDIIFLMDKGDSLRSFYEAFKHASCTYVLWEVVKIPEPWHNPKVAA